MPNTISPNMSLIIPTVGQEPGPEYAEDVNVSLTILDQHTHAPGSGVAITPDAIDITTALSFNDQFATNLAGLTLAAQLSTPANNTVYQSGVDLYFVDGVGNNVRITQSGAVAGSPGSISNLVAPASANYSSGTSTFVWQSNVSIAANMDFGAAIMRNLSPNSTFGVTLRPQPALGSNYTITLPSIPASLSFVTLDTSGNLSGSIPTSLGITGSNIASSTITSDKIVNTYRQLQTALLTSTQTWTSPADISTNTIFKITVVGAGGSGGRGGPSSFGGGGGGGGGTAIGWVSGLSPSTGYSVVVGTGGAGVSGGASNAGNSGGSSSFESSVIATGGGGGQSSGGTRPLLGGTGGIGTSGSVLIKGSSGGGGYNVSGLTNNGGQGGGTTLGGGGNASAGAVAGGAGGAYGGGGGGTGSATSGAGADGVVVIEWVQ